MSQAQQAFYTSLREQYEANPNQVFRATPDKFVVDPTQNGRAKPRTVSDKSIKLLADSIEQSRQEQPVVCYLNEEGAPVVGIGYGRHAAITLLNSRNGKKREVEFVIRPKEEVLLTSNISENTFREGLNPVDVAHNAARLREEGKTNQEIAKAMGVSAASVTQYLKVLDFTAPEQAAIAQNVVSFSAALQVADLEPEDRSKRMATMIDNAKHGVKTSARGARVAARGAKKAKGRNKAGKGGRAKAATLRRSVAEVRDFFISLADSPKSSGAVQKFAAATVKYIDGGSDKAYEKFVESTL